MLACVLSAIKKKENIDCMLLRYGNRLFSHDASFVVDYFSLMINILPCATMLFILMMEYIIYLCHGLLDSVIIITLRSSFLRNIGFDYK